MTSLDPATLRAKRRAIAAAAKRASRIIIALAVLGLVLGVLVGSGRLTPTPMAYWAGIMVAAAVLLLVDVVRLARADRQLARVEAARNHRM